MTQPPRVLVITSPPTPYRVPLWSRIAREPGLSVRVLFCGESEPTRDWKTAGTIDFPHAFLAGKYLTLSGKDQFFYFINPGIFRAMKAEPYDVAVVWGYWQFASLMGLLRGALTGTPTIMFGETHTIGGRARGKQLVKDAVAGWAIRRASAWLATGTLSKKHFLHYGAKEDGIFFFPNTPDVPALAARADEARLRRAAIRDALGIPETAPVVLFVGRFVPKKGLHHLVPAFLEVARRIPEARLLLVGDGPEAQRVRALAAPALDRVIFHGFAQPDRIAELYAAGDVLAAPSLDEPWGVVVNEGMAAGLPVVLSDAVGAAPDLVREGENGRVVPAGDVAGLAAALAMVLSDLPRARAMGEASRRIVSGWDYELGAASFKKAVAYALGPGRRDR
jgi:glycosyltransferase involved in cell wall biosynthesis